MEGTFLFDILSLARFCSFGNGFAEEAHELAIARVQMLIAGRGCITLYLRAYLSLVNLE